MTTAAISPRRYARLVAVAALGLVLTACGQSQQGGQQTPEVGFVTLEAGKVDLTTELSGRTSAFMASDVRPQVAGIIKKRLFTEGATVKAGDPLYQIDDATYKAARDQAAASLASAKATAKSAQAKASRYRSLTDIEAVSRQEADDVIAAADQAQAAVQQAQAALETAEIDLTYTKVNAPISGQIGRSSVTPGALVTANQADALAVITQLDPMYVDITESSSRILQLRKQLASGGVAAASAEMTIKLEDGSPYDQKGTVEFAESTVDQNTGSITIRARVANPDKLLLPGMFVRVSVNQAVLPDGILVPQQGITRNPVGKATALVVGAEDKVELREVVADRAIGDKWLITSGLKPGDKVIVEGTSKVRPGMQVKPVAVTLGKQA